MSKAIAPLDLLVVAPHPDDAEISVGGTILQCKRQRKRVGIIELTDGEPTPHGNPETRADETQAATAVLGLDWRGNLGLPNRSLESTMEARRLLAEVFRLTRPRIVLTPFSLDAHPDHVAASTLIDAARFWAKLTKTDMQGAPYWPPKLYHYWSIHLRVQPDAAFVFDISEVFEEKMRAIRCYASQFITGRDTTFPTILDDIEARARYWGWSIGTAYAEPFGSYEQVGISSFDAFN